jgi:hypothetical protein
MLQILTASSAPGTALYLIRRFLSVRSKVGTVQIFGKDPHDQNSIQKERLKSGNACYYSVQNLLSCSFLSENIKIKLRGTVILPVVWHGCETWSLILRKESRLRVFENRVLRRIFGPKRGEVTVEGRRRHNKESNYLCPLLDIIRVTKSRRMR